MAQTSMTADEVASLFARGQRVGTWNLTRKQAAWLAGVAQREAYRTGCRTEQRTFRGLLLDEDGQPNGARWLLGLYRNGAGTFELTDAQAEAEAERSHEDANRQAIIETLRDADAMLDAGTLPEGQTTAGFLTVRNLMARMNGLEERSAR